MDLEKIAKMLNFQRMRSFNQSELREAAEKKVLTYLTALSYDQKPWQWARERGLKFLPIPALTYDKNDPAKTSWAILVDFDNSDPSILNANFLMPSNGNYYCNIIYA